MRPLAHVVTTRHLHAPMWWYGGKGNRVARILRFIPADASIYVEPYSGAASLFFAKEPHPFEVLNDRDERVAHLFRALQDQEQFEALKHRLRDTACHTGHGTPPVPDRARRRVS